MISHRQVEGYEAMRIVNECEDFINVRQRILILHGVLIKMPLIRTHPESTMLIGYQYDGACVGTISWILR